METTTEVRKINATWYTGRRIFHKKGFASEIEVLADRRPLYGFNDEVNHSPDGFNWGYGGSGPAQLAYALVRDRYDKETALAYYQQFKDDFVVGLPYNEWKIAVCEIDCAIARYRQGMDMTECPCAKKAGNQCKGECGWPYDDGSEPEE